MKFITTAIILFIQSGILFSYDTVQEKTFQLDRREEIKDEQVEFDEEKVAQEENEQKSRTPSSFEKRRQEAVHWKIQQIIEKREARY
jgi:cytochrome c biogenesis factor